MKIATKKVLVSAQPYDPGTNTITRVINPGDKVDIPCSVVTPGGSVRWALNNKPIPLDSNQRRHWNISNDGKATLTINRVTKMDAGLWECWKLDGDFNIRQKVPIMRIVLNNVPEEPYLEFEGRLLSPHSTISVRANNLIKINCVIKGMTSMIKSVQWFVGQNNFTHQSRLLMEYSAEEDVSLTISVLTLNVSAKFHHEPLICQISHLSWPNIANVTARLNVLYPPEFSIVREPGFGFPIIEGMDLILRCEIDANPMSPVRWERDSDPKISNDSLAPIDTSPDGTLIIRPITLKDIGWYRCVTENELGFFASVGFFINVREASDEMTALVDQLRSQNPHLPSIPESSDDFHHRSSSSSSSSNDFRKIHDHSNRESHFQASRSNGPDFNNGYNNHQPQISSSSSSSNNECSPNSKSINNADGRPIIESINSTVIALIGSQITLIARFCCIPRPKKVYWIHRHLAMMPSRIIGRYTTRELIMSSNSMNCFTSNFIIDSVKPEDAGDVMFMVLNQKGIDHALISLNVTMASYSISSSSSSSSNGITTTSAAISMKTSISMILLISMFNVILNYRFLGMKHIIQINNNR
uniref:MAM domain-containing glycosylphosphatidylinositol anchor protein 1-like n=1 Tax=Dermatophagoides pteronyssinus TaxID=6956 RepID=A0A6P6XL70_DERPT|nr:MAM domain-containing glycosylphosphatidylinositol anchor protein 1-like [Dermatophagoides pteronyssinus]